MHGTAVTSPWDQLWCLRNSPMNIIRGTYWPSGARFLSVVSYWKKTEKVLGQGGHVISFNLLLLHVTKYSSNNALCSLKDLLSGMQSFNRWNCKLTTAADVIKLEIPSYFGFVIATDAKDLSLNPWCFSNGHFPSQPQLSDWLIIAREGVIRNRTLLLSLLMKCNCETHHKIQENEFFSQFLYIFMFSKSLLEG